MSYELVGPDGSNACKRCSTGVLVVAADALLIQQQERVSRTAIARPCDRWCCTRRSGL